MNEQHILRQNTRNKTGTENVLFNIILKNLTNPKKAETLRAFTLNLLKPKWSEGSLRLVQHPKAEYYTLYSAGHGTGNTVNGGFGSGLYFSSFQVGPENGETFGSSCPKVRHVAVKVLGEEVSSSCAGGWVSYSLFIFPSFKTSHTTLLDYGRHTRCQAL